MNVHYFPNAPRTKQDDPNSDSYNVPYPNTVPVTCKWSDTKMFCLTSF